MCHTTTILKVELTSKVEKCHHNVLHDKSVIAQFSQPEGYRCHREMCIILLASHFPKYSKEKPQTSLQSDYINKEHGLLIILLDLIRNPGTDIP